MIYLSKKVVAVVAAAVVAVVAVIVVVVGESLTRAPAKS